MVGSTTNELPRNSSIRNENGNENMAPRKMLTKPVEAQLRIDMNAALEAGTFILNEDQTVDAVIEHVRQGIKEDTYKPGVTFAELVAQWSGAEASSGDDATAQEPAPAEAEEPEPIDDLASWLDLYAKAKAKEKQSKEMADLAKAKITERLGDKTQATIGGQLVATWNWVESTRFDKGKLKAEHPEIVEQYTVPNPTRRFELK